MKRKDCILGMKLVVIKLLKDAWNCSYKEVTDMLVKYDLLDYMNYCYEYYNSMGAQGIINDIEDTIRLRKGEQGK